MGLGSNRPKNGPARYKKRVEHYYGDGYGVFVRDELRDSDAYLVLSFSARVVLIDMLRVYIKASQNEKINIRDVGFEYTFAMCRERISINSFGNSRKEVCRVGFFEMDSNLTLFSYTNRYAPSIRWKSYKATDEEACVLKKHQDNKCKRLLKDKKRLIDFRTGRTNPKTP